MKTLKKILFTGALVASLSGATAWAQSTTSTDVAVQELELKKKELDLQKARIEEQKSAQIDLQSKQLDLERQKLELEQAKQELKVKETQASLDMQLSGDVLFDSGKATIKSSAENTLRKVALIMREYPAGKVTVTGFTDNRGGENLNLKLSRDRAESVKTWLLSSAPDVSSERVLARGEGEDAPAASNETSDGRQLNRRVEISVNKL